MHLQPATIQITEGMLPYINTLKAETALKQRALLLYPYIYDGTIFHGRAAEILGVRKTDLIEYYNSIGIPYLNQTKDDLMKDLATLERVLKEEK